jgi:hypothetical protein
MTDTNTVIITGPSPVGVGLTKFSEGTGTR